MTQRRGGNWIRLTRFPTPFPGITQNTTGGSAEIIVASCKVFTPPETHRGASSLRDTAEGQGKTLRLSFHIWWSRNRARRTYPFRLARTENRTGRDETLRPHDSEVVI